MERPSDGRSDDRLTGTLYSGAVPEEQQTAPEDRQLAELDRPTVLREREHEPEPRPARAYPAEPETQTAAPQHPAPQLPVGQQPPVRPSGGGIFSNLNLNGPVPARVRPNIGEWGPTNLPSTKQKKRWRWLVPVLFAVAVIVVTVVGFFFWTMYR